MPFVSLNPPATTIFIATTPYVRPLFLPFATFLPPAGPASRFFASRAPRSLTDR